MLCNVGTFDLYHADSVSSAGRFVRRFQGVSGRWVIHNKGKFTNTETAAKYFVSHLYGEMEPEKLRATCGVIFVLSSDQYGLKKPIDVIIESSEDETLAIIPELELYGEGLTEMEAMDDLETEVIELYQYLNSVPKEKLGKSPKAWKKILDSVIEPKSGN